MKSGFCLVFLLVALPLAVAAVPPGSPNTLDVEQALESPPTRRPVINAAPPRGQLLYENHCRECHASQVHIRNRSKARNLAEIRRWVDQWSRQLGLDWTAQEIGDVVFYLNQTFYLYAK